MTANDWSPETRRPRVWLTRCGLLAVALAVVLPLEVVALSPRAGGPVIAQCAVLPPDDIWNTPVDTLPVDPSSDAYVATIGADVGFHADFGSGEYEGGPIGIPYVVVGGDQAAVDVSFTYAEESDQVPYPVPADAPIEGGPDGTGDRHVLVLNSDACTLFELYNAFPQADGTWAADSGAVFDLASSALRPDTWTSADAAGLPILPGLVRYDEVAAGEIGHALRFTTPETRQDHVWPARHDASDEQGADYPPMGQRFRLRADFDISGFSPEMQVILRALQKYGMILADNGSPWFISGVPDDRWDNDMLRELGQVLGSDFDAVDVSSLMVDPDSGQAITGAVAPAAPDGTAPLATAAEVVETTQPAATALGSVAADLFVDAARAGATGDGSMAAPFANIGEALAAAPDGSTIAVTSGDYPEPIVIRDRTIHLYGGYSAGFDARDPSTNVTSLIGDGTDSVVSLVNAGESTVDGFRITGGTNSVLPEFGDVGGGVYVQGGAPTISHNLIEGNDARPATPDGSDPVGGGIFAEDSNVSILDNVIRDNTAGRGGGVGITGGSPRVIGNTVQNNVGVADHGGGLYIAATDAQIEGNLIVGNEIGRELGYGWGGGLIVFGEGSSATLSFNEVTGNYAPSLGSGVFIDDGAEAILDHEFIHHNMCPTGDTTGGVGILVDGYDTIGSSVTIDHTTVAGHDCDTAGGNGMNVQGNSHATVTNSIFWGNGSDDFAIDGTSSILASFITSEEPIAGDGNLTADPMFADLASGDVHLLPGSPAVDAGDPAGSFDLEPDPDGGRVDQGRYGNTDATAIGS